MIKMFLYNAAGRDRELELKMTLPKLSSQQLLWIDITGRDEGDIERVAQILKLDSQCTNDLKKNTSGFRINTYGGYLHFDVASLEIQDEGAFSYRSKPKSVRLDFIVGKLWLVTVHHERLQFLDEFREQDRGETLIGRLNAAALASSLLDWHLDPYLEASEKLENFCDDLDQRIIQSVPKDSDILPEIVQSRLYISGLRRLLLPQRSVFYGLSRADVALITADTSENPFNNLEHHYERAVDIVEHGRDLVRSSFDLYSTRIAETTNVLIRRLTFISIMLGAIGAVAGVFGMNFDTSYAHTGEFGFWAVVISLSILGSVFAIVSRWKKWI